MKKVLFCILMVPFCVFADDKTKTINKLEKVNFELPDGLSWGMSIDDVKKIVLDVNKKTRDEKGNIYYSYRSNQADQSKKFQFHLLTFNKDGRLITIAENSNFYPEGDENAGNYDPTGSKAIALYKAYTSEFDLKYTIEKTENTNIEPLDKSKLTPTCKEMLCEIAVKRYKDDYNTESIVSIHSLNTKDERMVTVNIRFFEKKSQ